MVGLNSGLSILGRPVPFLEETGLTGGGSLDWGGSEGSAFPGRQAASGRSKLAPSRKGSSASAGPASNDAIAATVNNNKMHLNIRYLFPPKGGTRQPRRAT